MQKWTWTKIYLIQTKIFQIMTTFFLQQETSSNLLLVIVLRQGYCTIQGLEYGRDALELISTANTFEKIDILDLPKELDDLLDCAYEWKRIGSEYCIKNKTVSIYLPKEEIRK